MNASKTVKHALSGRDERVYSILSQVGGEFLDAADFLAAHNVSKELAQKVAEMMDEPLTFLHSQHVAACEGVANIMRKIVVAHVRQVAEAATVVGFWQVEQPSSSLTMEYVIALREYDLEHRALLRSFKRDYYCTQFAELVPLVLHLIPQKRAANVINSKQIDLE